MDRYLNASWPRDYRKWCAYVLLLVTPGSFILLPAVAMIKFLATRRQHERSSTCVPHV